MPAPVEKFWCSICDDFTVSRVLYTRTLDRRRECVRCGRRFTTTEVVKDERAEPHHHPPSKQVPLPF